MVHVKGTDAERIATITNVADLREYYLSDDLPPDVVKWRVRAERRLYGQPKNNLPAVSFGPGASVFTSENDVNPLDEASLRLRPRTAVSGEPAVVSGDGKAHSLVPAVTVAGEPTTPGDLYRVYVFTDSDCVNRVFIGYPVSSPAYAPRSAGGPRSRPAKHAMADGES